MKKVNSIDYLGKEVTLKIDRPLGTRHPQYGFIYLLNYGYMPDTISGDDEELDAYLIGEFEPVKTSSGKVIAIVRRTNDNDDRVLSISPSNFLTEMGKADMKERPGSVETYLRRQAIEKSGDPADLAFLVKCLIDERMKLLTASDIHLDGGWHGYNKGKVRW